MKIKTLHGENMKQLFIGAEPKKEKMSPITNEAGSKKPRGGLWTSTYDETIGSDWLQYIYRTNWHKEGEKAWLLTPAEDAKIMIIDSYEDLEEMMERYSEPVDNRIKLIRTIDFESIAERVDGVHLTEAGLEATHLSFPHNLYGYDAECTIWFRWTFAEVKAMPIDREWIK